MLDETAEYGEDALKGTDADDIKHGDGELNPVNVPTTPEDEGNVGDGTGAGDAGPSTPGAK